MPRDFCLVPFRATRYHIREFERGDSGYVFRPLGQLRQRTHFFLCQCDFHVCSPQDSHELFNLRHAVLRNVAERAIGVLKRRFPSPSNPRPYSFDFQVDLVYSLC